MKRVCVIMTYQTSDAPFEYRAFGEFVIDSLTPETISMARLAEYISALANFLGQSESVHFDRIESGSAVLKYWIEPGSISAVQEAPLAIAAGVAAPTLLAKFERLNSLLEKDGAQGKLDVSGVVMQFPGAAKPEFLDFGQITDEMSIDGQLVRIGGRDKSVPAQLQDGSQFYNCEVTRGLAMDLRHYLFGPVIRLNGRASWNRGRDGNWHLAKFVVREFQELDDRPVSELIYDMRRVPDNAWTVMEDPSAFLSNLRSEGDD